MAVPSLDQPIEMTSENAYRRIRADIVTGRLAPGRKLKLDMLRAEYQASVSTLRETLNRLIAEKLVVAEGQRGFEVAPISRANLTDIAALRLLLERRALEQSFARGEAAWEVRVLAAHDKLAQVEELMRQGDRADIDLYNRCDWQFHQALVSACGSNALMRAHAAAFDRYLRYQIIAMNYRDDIAAREHRELQAATLKRDAQSASRILARHIQGGVDHAIATGTIR